MNRTGNDKLASLLYGLGLSAKYIGFHCIVIAVEIASDNPRSLTIVTKEIYPQVAEELESNWKAVERNIRSAIRIIWEQNPEEVQRIANFRMEKKPTAAQFI